MSVWGPEIFPLALLPLILILILIIRDLLVIRWNQDQEQEDTRIGFAESGRRR